MKAGKGNTRQGSTNYLHQVEYHQVEYHGPDVRDRWRTFKDAYVKRRANSRYAFSPTRGKAVWCERISGRRPALPASDVAHQWSRRRADARGDSRRPCG